MELLELRLSNTNVVTSWIGQLKTCCNFLMQAKLWFNIKEVFQAVVLPKVNLADSEPQPY